MKMYQQLTLEERVLISYLVRQGFNLSEIARQMARHRSTNENTNGLIRQYIPKGTSMKDLTQAQCDRIAKKLNTRPRKRHGFKTPEEKLYG